MKRLFVTFVLVLCMCSTMVHAKVIGTTVSGGSSGLEGSSSSSGSGQIKITGSTDNVEVTVYFPDYAYYPKVTALHSLNAELAKDNNVYFIPKLADFPVNPADTAASTTDGAGKLHNEVVKTNPVSGAKYG